MNLVPIEWGSVTRNGKDHAWVTKPSGRRASVCGLTPDEEQDRWSAPHYSMADLCEVCMIRAGARDEILTEDIVTTVGRRYPHSVSISDLYHAFPVLTNEAVRVLVMEAICDDGWLAKITSPGYGERYLALKKLRVGLGIQKFSM